MGAGSLNAFQSFPSKVIHHSGTTKHGHYVCSALHAQDNTWLRFDDRDVEEAPFWLFLFTIQESVRDLVDQVTLAEVLDSEAADC